MARDKTMKALLASIEAKEAEVARLQAQIEALREVYNLQASVASGAAKTGVPVKTTVLDLLERVGANGLNANIVCEMAKADGVELQVKSVSSLLSRFKRDGTVVYYGSKYYLPQYKEKKSTPSMPDPLQPADVVRHLRTSG